MAAPGAPLPRLPLPSLLWLALSSPSSLLLSPCCPAPSAECCGPCPLEEQSRGSAWMGGGLCLGGGWAILPALWSGGRFHGCSGACGTPGKRIQRAQQGGEDQPTNEEQGEDDGELVDRVAQDVLHHGAGNQWLVSAVWLPQQQ